MTPKLSRYEFKITHRTKNHKHLSLNGKGQSLDVNSEMTLILNLSDQRKKLKQPLQDVSARN